MQFNVIIISIGERIRLLMYIGLTYGRISQVYNLYYSVTDFITHSYSYYIA